MVLNFRKPVRRGFGGRRIHQLTWREHNRKRAWHREIRVDVAAILCSHRINSQPDKINTGYIRHKDQEVHETIYQVQHRTRALKIDN